MFTSGRCAILQWLGKYYLNVESLVYKKYIYEYFYSHYIIVT